jgi:hypothetical protein
MTQALQATKPVNLGWMRGWCGALILFGIILMGAAFEVTSGPIRSLFDLFDFLRGSGELDLNSYMRFSLAILGAVTIGWSLTFMMVIQAANQLENRVSRPIWMGMTVSVITWYLIDSILSVTTGFWPNAVSSTILMATFLIPVIRSGVLRN